MQLTREITSLRPGVFRHSRGAIPQFGFRISGFGQAKGDGSEYAGEAEGDTCRLGLGADLEGPSGAGSDEEAELTGYGGFAL